MDKVIYDRMKGMIYGLVVGDCLGSCIEFSGKNDHDYITEYQDGGPYNLRAGDWTDDTSMTLAIMDSIISCDGEINGNDIMNRFCDWRYKGKYSSNGKCLDIGIANARTLQYYNFNQSGNSSNKMNQSESMGNGSIMRLAPTVIYDFIEEDETYEGSLIVSNLTHENAYIQSIVKDMCNILFSHLRGNRTTMESAYHSRNEASNSGLAYDTFNSALWAFNSTNDFEKGMIASVNLGGDSDTIGAVYGQIAGAYYGYDAIPKKWKRGIIKKVFIDNLFYDMMKVLTDGDETWQLNEKRFFRCFVRKIKQWMRRLLK